MSYSRHQVRFSAPLRGVRVRAGEQSLISEDQMRETLQERFDAGYNAGQRALGEQLVEQRKQLLDLQNGILRSLEGALPSLIAQCEKSLVLLALEAARKVVHATPIDATLVESVVRTALKELQDTAEYEVLLHPDDLTLLREVQAGILPHGESKKVQFNPDPRLQRGDCVVNTRHGSITAQREQMFQKMESAILC